MNRSWFVTGTDTGVGKTTVAAALLRQFSARGLTTVGMKPVATGCRLEGGLWVNDDAALLASHSSLPVEGYGKGGGAGGPPVPWSWINPYAFEPPIAPHIAAGEAGEEIRFDVIEGALQQLRSRADIVVVEGAGGFRVPLGPDGDTADLCRALRLPVILVVGMRLGCINHALLTAESVLSRGLALAGWVPNQLDPEMPVFEQNLATLLREIPAPCLGLSPFRSEEGSALPDLETGRLQQ